MVIKAETFSEGVIAMSVVVVGALVFFALQAGHALTSAAVLNQMPWCPVRRVSGPTVRTRGIV